MNFSSINFDSCWKLFLSLPAGSYINCLHCSWCIASLRVTAQKWKFEKLINIHWNTKFFRRSFKTPIELFCKDLLILALRMRQDFIWLQPIYFLTIIVFLSVKFLFLIVEVTLNQLHQSVSWAKDIVREVFIVQISHDGKFKYCINFDCFIIDKSNQIKTSCKILWCQSLFLKIALGTRLAYIYTSRNTYWCINTLYTHTQCIYTMHMQLRHFTQSETFKSCYFCIILLQDSFLSWSWLFIRIMTLSCNSGIFLCSPWFFPKFGWYMVYSVLKKFLTYFPKKNLLWKGF